MPYALSFSADFFCDGDPDVIEPSDRPTSVYQAVLSMGRETWDQMARDVFGVDACHLDSWTVLEKVRQTDTCGNLDSPVEVWIDREGYYDLFVYDKTRDGA